MAGIGIQELLVIIFSVLSVVSGRFLAHRIADDKRKLFGGIALFIAAILAFWGISSYNSAILPMQQQKAAVGIIMTFVGVLLGLFGIAMLASKSRQLSS